MVCTQCGAEVPAGARFCPSCGHPTAAPGDQRRVVTVLFADIVGFTTLSETLDPERVKRLVDSWFERLVTDIAEFGGRVDKIIGDGILALFGAPVAHEDDAERAVRAALRMQETLATMSERAVGLAGERSPKVQMRIGVNTGEVLVGALRADGATTAMGDVVNTASRLQTAARPGEVLIGPTTHVLTAHAIGSERRGMLTARGRDAPVEAWSATCALLPPGQRPARDHTPLVGRDRELSLLDAAVAAALGHSRALVSVVVGDTGVGKTRLVREAAERLAGGRDLLVLEGRCVPYGEANVWWPLAEALHGECDVDPTSDLSEVHDAVWARVAAALGDDAAEDHVDRTTAGLLVLMGHDTSGGGQDPGRAREAAVDAFIDFVEGHARRRPVVLLLSDIHWADDDLLVLLETLLGRLARCPLVILATARQAVRERWTPPPGRHDTLVINLDPLEDGPAGELLDALHGGEVPEELRADLLARSGGNPFFLEELVAYVDAAAPGAARRGLPDTLRGIVAARLDALGPDECDVLTDAAVIGRRGPIHALGEMAAEMGRAVDVEAVVTRLAANELLDIEGRYWEFRSEIAREVAYATLPKADRAKRHAGIAAWLEARATEDLDGAVDLDALRAEELIAGTPEIDDATVNRIAHHWAAAAELVVEMGEVAMVGANVADRAVCWLSASARRAQRRDLLPAAERAFGRALDLAGPDPLDRRIRLLVSRSRVRTDRWDLTGARADAEAALAGAAAAGDRGLEAAAVLRLGDVDQRAGDTSAAVARLRHAADRFAAEGDERGHGEALRLLGMTQMFAGRTVDAAATVEEAREAFARAGDRAGEGWAAQNMAWIALLDGDLDRTEDEVDRALALFAEVGELVGTAWSRGLLAFVRFSQGRREDAEVLAERVLAGAAEGGDRWATAMMRGLLGSLRLWDGRVADALIETAAATQGFRDLGDTWGLSVSLATHGRALAMSGDVDEGFRAVREAAEVHQVSSPPGGPGLMACVALAVQVGEPERAGDSLATASVRRSAGTLGIPESDSTLALARLQQGEVPDPPDPGGRAFGYAAAALVAAGAGDLDAALEAADAVPGCGEATFLDRALADVAAALALVRAGRIDEGSDRVERACRTLDATDDMVGRVMVGLARVVVAEAGGLPAAVTNRSEVAVALARLGLTATGWETAFSLAAGVRPRAEVS
ncbi:adenylate/guanylate cyclase domain-containing protein [Iamia sp.]|uniref:adenylate/guanylate cyclase domain-containing protein n=1 Tax=Iamia sp. TaxID=2722710 RepID=UPI002C65E769|nr:adenylate/guanylate cyclase domain-containing protein [Iamia sp.]HXH58959.1 adenylate/guanylate cyclase domain-containing protein [Iamia sp.]